MANQIRRCYMHPDDAWEETEGGGVPPHEPARYELVAHLPGSVDRIWVCSADCAREAVRELEYTPRPSRERSRETVSELSS